MEQNNGATTHMQLPDGFFYANDDEKTEGILTKKYDNGSTVKKVKLPECGKEAVTRKLKAKDTIEIARLMKGKQERYQLATVTVATNFDGKKATIEEVEELDLRDFKLLMLMNEELN